MAAPGLSELLQYQGNPALAGGTGTGGVFGVADFGRTLDAVDRLTAASNAFNRDIWYNNNLQMQQQALDAANNLKVTYGDLIPEDRGVIDKAVKEMYDFYRNNPNAVSYRVDPKDPTKNNAAEYNQFLQRRQNLDHYIVRGNLRAEQLGKIDAVRKTITDPAKLADFDNQIGLERQKPIDQNLLIPPDLAKFDYLKYIDAASANGQQEYDFLQNMPDYALAVTNNLFDPIKARAAVMSDIYSGTPLGQDVSRTLANQMTMINGILDQYRVPDGKGGTKLDMARLMADPNGKPLVDMANMYNQQVRNLNSLDWVEGGKKSQFKPREHLGYSQDIPTIDLNNLSIEDLVGMSMNHKFGKKQSIKFQQTDNALQYATLAQRKAEAQWDKDKFWYGINTGKEGENNVADEKLNALVNLVDAPNQEGAVPLGEYRTAYPVTETRDKDGNLIKRETSKTGTPLPPRFLGYEVPVTPVLSQILAIPKDKSKTTTKETTGETSWNNTNQPYTLTTEESAFNRPYRIVVKQDDKDKTNPNKNRIDVKYDDGTVKTFTPAQLFTEFNKIYGTDNKIQSKVSEVAMKRLTQMGISDIGDIRAMKQKLANIVQPTIQDLMKPPQSVRMGGTQSRLLGQPYGQQQQQQSSGLLGMPYGQGRR